MIGSVRKIIYDKGDLTIPEVLYLCTMGGAKCLNLDNKIGSFEIGKDFDALILEKSNDTVEIYEWDTWDEILTKLVLEGSIQNIKKVYVNGEEAKLD